METQYLNYTEISIKYKINQTLALNTCKGVTDFVIKKGRKCYNVKDKIVKTMIKYGRSGMVTKTVTKTEYNLKEKDLQRLHFVEMKNPHYACASPMKLYYINQIEQYLKKITLNQPL